jgi:hypothetical protein
VSNMEAEILLDRLARRGAKRFIDENLEVVNPCEGGVRVEETKVIGIHD